MDKILHEARTSLISDIAILKGGETHFAYRRHTKLDVEKTRLFSRKKYIEKGYDNWRISKSQDGLYDSLRHQTIKVGQESDYHMHIVGGRLHDMHAVVFRVGGKEYKKYFKSIHAANDFYHDIKDCKDEWFDLMKKY